MGRFVGGEGHGDASSGFQVVQGEGDDGGMLGREGDIGGWNKSSVGVRREGKGGLEPFTRLN